MIQPKYDPKESLERIKLMMNYDSAKTLNENKKSVSILTEADDDSSGGLGNAGSYAAGLTTPKLYNAGKNVLGKLFTKGAAKTAAQTVAQTATEVGVPAATLNSMLGMGASAPAIASLTPELAGGAGASTGLISTIGASMASNPVGWVIGGVVATAFLGYWLYDSLHNGMPTADKVKKFFEGCQSQSKSLKPEKTQQELIAAADNIYKAIKDTTLGFLPGTDENLIKKTLASMSTPADLCGLKVQYDYRYGDIYEDLDGDIDGDDWKTYVWAPMANIIQKATEEVKEAIKPIENPTVPAAPDVIPPVNGNSEEDVDDNSEENVDQPNPSDIKNQL